MVMLVRDSARIKYKLMYVMVYFLPAKNKQQLLSCIGFPDIGMVVRHVDIRQYNDKVYNYYTYLNSDLLKAPRKYLLHGLVPGLD